jgi:hypothetical protein
MWYGMDYFRHSVVALKYRGDYYERGMSGWEGSYKDRIERAIRRQQKKQVLSKEDSMRIIEAECPFCEYVGDCDRIVDESSKGHIRQICKKRSTELDTIWIEIGMDRSRVDVGDKYGKLTVLEQDGYDKHGNPLWKCQCGCGITKSVLGLNLLNGHSTTCGSRFRHKNDERSNTDIGASTVNIEDKKKRKYICGSSINPDGSKHVIPSSYHSKVGCTVSMRIYTIKTKPIKFKCNVKNELVESRLLGIYPGTLETVWWCEKCAVEARSRKEYPDAWHDIDDEEIEYQLLRIAIPHMERMYLI